MMTCNQCGVELNTQTEIGLGFNMGHGPVYVCIKCAPPSSVEDTLSMFERFVKGVEEQCER